MLTLTKSQNGTNCGSEGSFQGVYIPYGKSQLQGFKKAEMAKTLKNGLSMIETNPLNHNWSHFVILSGLTLHQFQKNCC